MNLVTIACLCLISFPSPGPQLHLTLLSSVNDHDHGLFLLARECSDLAGAESLSRSCSLLWMCGGSSEHWQTNQIRHWKPILRHLPQEQWTQKYYLKLIKVILKTQLIIVVKCLMMFQNLKLGLLFVTAKSKCAVIDQFQCIDCFVSSKWLWQSSIEPVKRSKPLVLSSSNVYFFFNPNIPGIWERAL